MSPPNPQPVPTKLPDDLWHDIQRVKERMLTFLADAQRAAEEEERLGTFDAALYRWLDPMATAVQQMGAIKRNGPRMANVVPLPIGRTVRR
jgi:hypothetical protein